jgi:hypothetical protein
LTVGSLAICPHGGQISAITENNRVFIAGQPAVTQSDVFAIAGCAFRVAVHHPCIFTKWLVPAMRILIEGKPAILQNSIGICQSADQAPQGPPVILTTQERVRGV